MTATAHTHRWRPASPTSRWSQGELTLHANRFYEALLNTHTTLHDELRLFPYNPGTRSSALLLARSLERAGQPATILQTPAGQAWVASDEMHLDLGHLIPDGPSISVSVSKVLPTYDPCHPFDLRAEPSHHLAFDLPEVLEDERIVRTFLRQPYTPGGSIRPTKASWGDTLRLSCGHWLLGNQVKGRACPYCEPESGTE